MMRSFNRRQANKTLFQTPTSIVLSLPVSQHTSGGKSSWLLLLPMLLPMPLLLLEGKKGDEKGDEKGNGVAAAKNIATGAKNIARLIEDNLTVFVGSLTN
jgi:hypothetical protein